MSTLFGVIVLFLVTGIVALYQKKNGMVPRPTYERLRKELVRDLVTIQEQMNIIHDSAWRNNSRAHLSDEQRASWRGRIEPNLAEWRKITRPPKEFARCHGVVQDLGNQVMEELGADSLDTSLVREANDTTRDLVTALAAEE